MKNFGKNNKVDSKQKLTLDAIKSAAKSVTTADALSKVSGGTLAVCHTPGCPGGMTGSI